MRTRYATILAAVAAATIGIAWFAMRERDAATAPVDETPVKKKVSKDVPTKARRTAPAAKPKPTLQAAEKREPEKQATKAEEKPAQEEQAAPANEEQAAQQQKDDNPFPRYLDMFKNNPEALAAEFQKEAEVDRARQAKMREKAIAMLKLNPEQAAVFEKALDDLRNTVTRLCQEHVDLITGGLLYEDTAADGRIWDSNPLLCQRFVTARESAVQATAEKLYEELAIDGVPEPVRQRVLSRVAYQTSFAFETLEPNLAVYDKVYKNMGVGKGIFSWRSPQRQQQGKK